MSFVTKSWLAGKALPGGRPLAEIWKDFASR